MYKGLGAIKSEFNPDTLVADSFYAFANSPTSLDLRSSLMPVRDQGSQPTCVAQAFACVKEYQERKSIGFKEYMSPQFMYNNRSNHPSEGMTGPNACAILKNMGMCSEYSYRYGTHGPITAELINEAGHFKIKSYAQVYSIDTLKTILSTQGPCVIFFPVYNYGSQFWIQTPGEKIIGGHAVTIVGYDEKGFILRNSWGDDWGNKGYTIYPYGHFGKHWEIWTTLDADSPPYKPNPPYDPNDKCCIVT